MYIHYLQDLDGGLFCCCFFFSFLSFSKERKKTKQDYLKRARSTAMRALAWNVVKIQKAGAVEQLLLIRYMNLNKAILVPKPLWATVKWSTLQLANQAPSLGQGHSVRCTSAQWESSGYNAALGALVWKCSGDDAQTSDNKYLLCCVTP